MKQLKFFLFLSFFLVKAEYSKPFAEQTYQGIVCLKLNMCNYMLLYLNNGNYSIAEDLDTICTEGDTLVAELKTIGEMNARNITKNTVCHIRVELWEYNKVTSMQHLIKVCKNSK